MERELAELVVKDLKNQEGPQLTVLEAMYMTKIASDNLDVYAVQKNDATILAMVFAKDKIVKTKIIAW